MLRFQAIAALLVSLLLCCNKKRVDGVVVAYQPDAGFTGADSIDTETIFASGGLSKRHYAIEVK